MRVIIFILLLLPTALSAQVIKNPTESDCLSYMTFREGGGESVKVVRAVMDVAYNRMKMRKLTMCQVLKQKGQYPYAKHGVKRIRREFLTKYLEAYNMKPVLRDDRYIYFNHVKHSFGKSTKKIGNLYFQK